MQGEVIRPAFKNWHVENAITEQAARDFLKQHHMEQYLDLAKNTPIVPKDRE